MNYELGLGAMNDLGRGADWFLDFALLESRLQETLREERLFGPSPQTSQERFRVVNQLNALAVAKIGVSFTDLCLGKSPTTPASPAPSDERQGAIDLLNQILHEIKQGRSEDREISAQILAALAQNRIEQTDATEITAELQAWAQRVEQGGLPLSPELKMAVDALTDHSGGVYQYLQLALPIIPGILSYNVELGSQHQANLRSIWHRIKDRISGVQQSKGQGIDPSIHPPVINSGKAWALLVGVNDYEDFSISDLKVCTDDVTAIHQSLYKSYEVTKLLSEGTIADCLPTRSHILNELSAVSQAAEEGDLLLFYFSGHGIAESGESYLLPRDAGIAALKHTSISMRSVREIMDESAARAKVIILDACHSGASIGKSETVMTEEFIRRVFEEAEGMVVLASCKQGQKSWEWPEQGRSVFTYYLLEALAGQADFDNKGFVTVSDVNRYVSDGVRRWAAEHGVPQTPTMQSSVAGDIMLVRYA